MALLFESIKFHQKYIDCMSQNIKGIISSPGILREGAKGLEAQAAPFF
jgi:hypothetical protein